MVAHGHGWDSTAVKYERSSIYVLIYIYKYTYTKNMYMYMQYLGLRWANQSKLKFKPRFSLWRSIYIYICHKHASTLKSSAPATLDRWILIMYIYIYISCSWSYNISYIYILICLSTGQSRLCSGSLGYSTTQLDGTGIFGHSTNLNTYTDCNNGCLLTVPHKKKENIYIYQKRKNWVTCLFWGLHHYLS